MSQQRRPPQGRLILLLGSPRKCINGRKQLSHRVLFSNRHGFDGGVPGGHVEGCCSEVFGSARTIPLDHQRGELLVAERDNRVGTNTITISRLVCA